jgi:Probable cobalt transporter subunit (CbtA)
LVGSLILRGLIVGVVAGLLAFGFAKMFGEPAVDVAIDFEAAHSEAERAQQIAKGITPAPEEPELFSRTVQSGVGLLTGVVGVGAGIGAIFGVLFAFGNGRMDKLGPGATSTLLAFYALWSVYVIPALKYPANPPSVGEPETIQLRTGLYFLIMAISIATTIGALMLRRGLVAKYGSWAGSVLAFVAYLAVISFFFAVLPAIDEVPGDFPATTLWQFRIASLGIQAVLWGSTGLIFGWLAERSMGSRAPAGRHAAATR